MRFGCLQHILYSITKMKHGGADLRKGGALAAEPRVSSGRKTAIRRRPRAEGQPLAGASARADFSESTRGSTRGDVSWRYVRAF